MGLDALGVVEVVLIGVGLIRVDWVEVIRRWWAWRMGRSNDDGSGGDTQACPQFKYSHAEQSRAWS